MTFDLSIVLEKLRPESFVEGNILDTSGKILGKHEGIANFTIGQRKGIKIASNEPFFVIRINSEKNEVVVGSKEELLITNIYLKNINFLCEPKNLNGDFLVKVRSTGNLLPCKLSENGQKVTLESGEAGVSPGQACVFYRKDELGVRVFGGGWIYKTEK